MKNLIDLYLERRIRMKVDLNMMKAFVKDNWIAIVAGATTGGLISEIYFNKELLKELREKSYLLGRTTALCEYQQRTISGYEEMNKDLKKRLEHVIGLKREAEVLYNKSKEIKLFNNEGEKIEFIKPTKEES